MKIKLLLIFFFILYSDFLSAQVNIIYFDGIRKDKIYFTWKVESKLKTLTYILQASNDKINYIDVLTYKTEHKSFDNSLFLNFIYFRLKIMTSKECYIYSDVIYIKDKQSIKILPDPGGSNTIYIISQEKGVCYIYNKTNETVFMQSIDEGHNQICYNLKHGEYYVKVFTDCCNNEIKIFAK